MKKRRRDAGRGAAEKGGTTRRPELPPARPDLEALEGLAASETPSLPAAWWTTHQVTEHVFSTVAATDARTGEALPQPLTDILRGVRGATTEGRRPFPHDRLFAAARFAAEPLAHLLEHHRHRTIRAHEQLPFHQLREVDDRSLAWLARQPGRNVREKLSGRTHALGVKRHRTADTTENRLLRSFAKVLARRAGERLAHAEAYDRGTSDQERQSELADMLHLCDERLRRTEIAEIPPVTRLQPNNVLLSDPLYSKVFRAWKWLRDEEETLGRSWATVLDGARTLLCWMIAASLAARDGLVIADTLGRVVVGRDDHASMGIELVRTESGRGVWSLNPPLQLLVVPSRDTQDVFHIRLSLEGTFLAVHVASLKGPGVLREARGSALVFEVQAEPERLAPGRGLGIVVDGLEGAPRAVRQTHADLAGLAPLAERLAGQILERCGVRQAVWRAAPALPGPMADTARIGVELGSTALRVTDEHPLALATEAWTVAVDLPDGARSAAWLEGRTDRRVAAGEAGRSIWAMRDILEPDTDADQGMLALTARHIVHDLANELALPAGARVAYAVPDSMDELSQRSLRGAVSASLHQAVPIWRSVAAAMAWGLSSESGVRPGDAVIVVDTALSSATITVLVARHDGKVERQHPTSRGIYWERKPPLPPDEHLDILGSSHVLRAYARTLVERAARDDLNEEQQGTIVRDLLRTGVIEQLVERGGSAFVHVPSARGTGHDVLELRHDPDELGILSDRWFEHLERAVEEALQGLEAIPRSAPILIMGGPRAHVRLVPAARTMGRIKHFDEARGFGFIALEEGGADAFVHVSSVRPGYAPRPGDLVELDVVAGARGPVARQVCPASRLWRWRGRRVSPISPEDVSRGARDCLLRLDTVCYAWKEWLPDLSLEVVRDGHHGDLPLLTRGTIVAPFLGDAVQIKVPKTLTLPRGEPWYSFPLIAGREGQRPMAWEARLESRAFPLHHDLQVSLRLAYQYGLETSYTLTVVPESPEGAPFSSIEARWVEGGSRAGGDAPDLDIGAPGPEDWTPELCGQLARAAALVDNMPDEQLERRVLPVVRDCWARGRSLATAPNHARTAAAALIESLLRRPSDTDTDPVSAEVPVVFRILALMHEDAPPALADHVADRDDAAGDDRDRAAAVIKLLGDLAGDGRPERHHHVERLIRRLERYGSLESFNPPLARRALAALAIAVWRHPRLAPSFSDREAGAVVSHVRRMLSNLLTRVPATISTPEEREKTEKLYGGPFRDACELLLALVWWRGANPVPSLACGTAVADSLAKAIRQLDARFARNGAHLRFRLRLDVEPPGHLWRMSRTAFALDALLSGGGGRNLLHLASDDEA